MSFVRNLCSTVLASILILIFSAPSSAGVLDGNADALTFPGFTGSQSFVNGSLAGTFDYAVFTADEFATAFPLSSWTPGGPVVYAYQLENSGTAVISAQIVGVTNDVTIPHDIDSFEDAVGEVAPSSAAFGPTTATWSFTAPPFLKTSEISHILVFSSPNIPMLGASLTLDTGTQAFLTDIPTPSGDQIPEPASLVLLGMGSLWFLSLRRRS